MTYTFVLLISSVIGIKNEHTNPPPVLKNLFFVPEWDFNLSQITDEAENCLAGRGLTNVNLEVEAIWVGRKKRAKSDIVIYDQIYVEK
jgi:hypothetical protein